MAKERPAGPYPIDGVKSIETWLVRFDKDGACVSPGTSRALVDRVRGIPDCHVIFFSHGWQTDFDDAISQYAGFLKEFETQLANSPLQGKNLLFAGITWPSKWFAFDNGPKMAGAGSDAAAEAVGEITARLDEAQRTRAYELAARNALTEAEAIELGSLFAASTSLTVQDQADVALSVADAIKLAAALPSTSDADDDAIGTVGGGGGPQAAGEAKIDPLGIVRLFSLYQMKDRAGRVGSRGVSALLTDLLAVAAGLHLVGHSFGCKVMLSALCTGSQPAKAAKNMLLLQPAISHLCFAPQLDNRIGRGGYSAAPGRVSGRILTTYSAHDQPLHNIFHLALRRAADVGEAGAAGAGNPPNKYAALGGYGPRECGEVLFELPPAGAPVPGGNAKIVGLDGTTDKRVWSHGGVNSPHTAWLLRDLIAGS